MMELTEYLYHLLVVTCTEDLPVPVKLKTSDRLHFTKRPCLFWKIFGYTDLPSRRNPFSCI